MAREFLRDINFVINELFNAKSIMTDITDIRLFHLNDNKNIILNYLKENEFDIGIVDIDDGNYGFIIKNEIEGLNDNNWNGLLRTINDNQIVSPNSMIVEVIKKFANTRYIFIISNNRINGLITYADLNKLPVQVFCFMAISEFENILRDVIIKKYENESWLKRLSHEGQKEIGGTYIMEKANGVEISLLQCTNLIHLNKILKKDGNWIREVGFDSRANFEQKMGKLNDLRNKIMHQRYIILNSEGGKELQEILDYLGERLGDIKEWINNNP